MSVEDKKDSSKTTVELTHLQSDLITKLIKCSTAHYEDYSTYEDGDGYDLTLDYLVNEETKRAFQLHFGIGVAGSKEASLAASALNLFHSFQMLLTLNYYQVSNTAKSELYKSESLYVNETISIPASHDRIMRFKDFEIIKDGVKSTLYSKSLSDGEHQFLHTIGMCLLFRHQPALFLLDEPETHLNPDWRASYISTLRQSLDADDSNHDTMREVLLTSHSPFVVSDCQRENVLIFKKDRTSGSVVCETPSFNTFGASANAITIRIFGQVETIGDYAMSKIQDFRERLNGGEDPDQLIEESDILGDSVEKVLFINQALTRKEKE